MCAWLVCIVCNDVKPTGFLDDKRIRKTVCGPFCYNVLLDWAKLPDPKPSLMQRYLDRKYPMEQRKSDDDDEDIFT